MNRPNLPDPEIEDMQIALIGLGPAHHTLNLKGSDPINSCRCATSAICPGP